MSDVQIESTESTPVKWCVMFYMVGDNNLGDEMIRTLSDVHGSNNDKIALYAQFDGPHPMVDSVRMNLQKKVPGTLRHEYAVNISVDRSASREAIYDFVVACVSGGPSEGNLFPGTRAENYALVLSGHGDGIQQRTLLLDESPEGSVSVHEVSQLLDDLATKLGVKINVLGFDSCLMNSLEVSYEFRENAGLIVASQGNILNAGWNLASICREIDANGSSMTSSGLAQLLADRLVDSNRPFVEEAKRSADLSVCDLSRLTETSNLTTSLKTIAEALIPYFPIAIKGQPERFLDRSEKLEYEIIRGSIQLAHLRCQRFLSEQSIDLYDFCDLLKDQLLGMRSMLEWAGAGSNVSRKLRETLRDLALKCDSIMKAIKLSNSKFVRYGRASGPDAQFANGVSIFFPWSLIALSLVEKKYDELAFSAIGAGRAWKTFFRGFLDHTHRDRRGEPVAPPFYKDAPPFYRGSLIFEDFFRQMSNFAIDHGDAVTSDPYKTISPVSPSPNADSSADAATS